MLSKVSTMGATAHSGGAPRAIRRLMVGEATRADWDTPFELTDAVRARMARSVRWSSRRSSLSIDVGTARCMTRWPMAKVTPHDCVERLWLWMKPRNCPSCR